MKLKCLIRILDDLMEFVDDLFFNGLMFLIIIEWNAHFRQYLIINFFKID